MASDGDESGEGEGAELKGEVGLVQVGDQGQEESRLECPGDDVEGKITLDQFHM